MRSGPHQDARWSGGDATTSPPVTEGLTIVYTANTTTTVLAKTCATSAAYVQVTAAVIAGRSYTLTMPSHDDNYASDPSLTKFDDVAVT